MKTTNFSFWLAVIALTLGLNITAYSQSDNTLFWLRSVPQIKKFNPAMLPNAKFFLGLPVVSSVWVGVRNTGFAFGDFYRKDNLGDYYWDHDNMLSKLSARNYFDADTGIDIFSMGFNIGKGFLSIGIHENLYTKFTYPKDLMLLISKGVNYFDSNNIVPDFVNSEIGAMHFREYVLGYSFPISERLNFGLSLKAVQGLGKFDFIARRLDLTQGVKGNYLLDAELELNFAFPFKLGPFETLGDNFENDFDPKDYLIGLRNFGAAIDIGLVYKPTEMLSIGLSAINLGFINWSSGIENFRLSGQTDFQGIEFNNSGNEEGATSGSAFKEIRDALSNAFDVSSTNTTMRQSIPTRLYASVGLHLGKVQTIGLVSRTIVFEGNLNPSLTFSYNLTPINAIGLAVSYTVVDKAPSHFGAGFNLNLGPLQVYAVSDNASGALDPAAIQTINARLGLNFVFGNRHKKKPSEPSREHNFFLPPRE